MKSKNDYPRTHAALFRKAVNTDAKPVNTIVPVLTEKALDGLAAMLPTLRAEHKEANARRSDRHKPGYMAEYMRKRRAK